MEMPRAMPTAVSPVSFFLHNAYLISTLSAFVLVLVLTPFTKQFAIKHNRVDLPSHRKVHQQPVPRTGGIAICLATMAALSAVLLTGETDNLLGGENNLVNLQLLVAGSLCFFFIGLVDDFLDLPAGLRLVAQFVVACLLWVSGMRIESLSLPMLETIQLGLLSLPITVVWIAGVVNAINWIDGLDGLASGVGSIAAIASFVICLQADQLAPALVCSALLGSLLGFLFFNFNPAQIFMGDGGSHFVGFVLAAVCITGLDSETTSVTVLLPLLILAIPLLDMTAVILARVGNGESPFAADNRHLHHRLLQMGLSHRATVIIIYAISFWAASLALVYISVPGSFFALCIATGWLISMGQRALSATSQEAFFS